MTQHRPSSSSSTQASSTQASSTQASSTSHSGNTDWGTAFVSQYEVSRQEYERDTEQEAEHGNGGEERRETLRALIVARLEKEDA